MRPFYKRAAFRVGLMLAAVLFADLLFGWKAAALLAITINAISIEILFKKLRDM